MTREAREWAESISNLNTSKLKGEGGPRCPCPSASSCIRTAGQWGWGMAPSTCGQQALGVATLVQHFLSSISSVALGAGQEARGSKGQMGSLSWQLVVWLRPRRVLTEILSWGKAECGCTYNRPLLQTDIRRPFEAPLTGREENPELNAVPLRRLRTNGVLSK